jgi:hypothetical protein
MSEEQLVAELNELEKEIIPSSNSIVKVKDKFSYFNKTIRNRSFHRKSYGRISMYDIFGVPDTYKFDKVGPLFERRINDKTIIVLGGGNSMNDFLSTKKFHPKKIVNVDPYIKKEKINKNKRGIYESFSLGAESEFLVSELENSSIQKVDEIWASYSVPFYLETAEAIHSMFKNMDALLSEGGVLRITPLYLSEFSTESKEIFGVADSFDERKRAFIGAVKQLLDTGKYNLYVLSRGMHLEKLK